MEVKIARWLDRDDFDRQGLSIVDAEGNEKISLYIRSLSECPEDAIIGRDLIDADDILRYMKLAYEAGKAGEELIVTEISREEFE